MDNKNYYDPSDESVELYKKIILGITVCLGLFGLYTVYTVFTTDIEWGFKINWNCLESPFFPILSVIGFFLQFFNWQHMSMESWIGRKGPNDSDFKWERNHDIMDSMFGGCLWPLLSHLLIIPCAYGAAMWYVIMGLLHILGKLSPFFITLLVAAAVFFYYRWASGFQTHKYRAVMMIALALVVVALFGGTTYYMTHPGILSSASTIGKGKEKPIGVCRITGNGVNLRQGPGTTYDKTGILVSSGESYPLLGESGDWVRIDYNGTSAWISSQFCHIQYSSGYAPSITEDEDPGCWTGDEAEGGEEQTIPDRADERQAEPREAESSSETVRSPVNDMEAPTQIELVEEDPAVPAPMPATQPKDDQNVYTAVEQQPDYPGGMAALMKWLSENIRYPEAALDNDVQGRVVVKFIVEKDGSISNPQIVKSVDKDLDREALRVVGKMPRWIPGKKDGMPVRTYYTVPVSFRIR